jgi:hypothetical protein
LQGHGNVVTDKNLEHHIPDAKKGGEDAPQTGSPGKKPIVSPKAREAERKAADSIKAKQRLHSLVASLVASQPPSSSALLDVLAYAPSPTDSTDAAADQSLLPLTDLPLGDADLHLLLRQGRRAEVSAALTALGVGEGALSAGVEQGLALLDEGAARAAVAVLEHSWDAAPPEAPFPKEEVAVEVAVEDGTKASIGVGLGQSCSAGKFSWRQRVSQVEMRVPLPRFDGAAGQSTGLCSKHVSVAISPTHITVKVLSRGHVRYSLRRATANAVGGTREVEWGCMLGNGEGQADGGGEGEEVVVEEVVVLDEQLRQKVKASESIWWLQPMPPLGPGVEHTLAGAAGVGDGGAGMLLVLQLHKWHQRDAGNCRDASQTWWRTAFLNAGEIEDPEASYPPTEYYALKDDADPA